MKQCYLLLVLLCMALSAFSQETPRLHWKDIAQNPSLLTPAVALQLSKQGFDKDGFLPPVNQLSYNLTDSAHIALWYPDFSEWLPFERTYYVNDCDLGRPISRLVQRKDDLSGDFNDILKNEYTYFPDGAEKRTAEAIWIINSNEWLDTRYVSYISPGKPEEQWNKDWDYFTQIVYGGDRTAYEYNAEEQLVRSDNYELDTVTNTWVLSTSRLLTYENGKLVLEQTGDYDMGTWAPYTQVVYTYDSNGNNDSQSFETDAGQQFQLYTNTYDSENRLVERLIQNKNNNGGIFQNYQKDIYTYYPNGQTKIQDSYTWLSMQQEWLWSFQVSYREDGQFVNFISKYAYDEQLGGFQFGNWVEFHFDSDGLVTDYLVQNLIGPSLDDWEPNYQFIFSYDGNDRPLTELLQYWDAADMVFTDNRLTDYFNTGCLYSELTNTVPAKVDCSYANPIVLGQPIVCPALEQNGEQTLRLYNMTGQEVHTQSFRSGGSIQPHQALVPGMYVLTITGNGGLSYRSKVVVL